VIVFGIVIFVPAVVELIGKPGGTPGPVKMEDPRFNDEPSLRGEVRARWHILGGVDIIPRTGLLCTMERVKRSILNSVIPTRGGV